MVSNQNIDEQIVCMSALFLAVETVETLAKTGRCEMTIIEALLPSLLRRNQNQALEYYDHHATLDYGREILLNMLNKQLDPQIMRYALQLIHIERKLSNNAQLMSVLGQRLKQVAEQAEHFGIGHDNVLANIASIYSDTASKAATKIMVSGEPSILNQQENINKIRSLLMCGVRACSLWRANGGGRWQLIVVRGKMAQRAAAMSLA